MSLTVKTRVSKKYAIYLPKAIVKAVGLREGEKILLRVEGSTVIIESLQDPLELALSGKKFTSLKPEQAEAISLEEQASQIKSSP